MSAAWQLGPSHPPFNHTSNSQYGSWSGNNGFSGGSIPSSTSRKVGGAYVPTPPASRISEVTAKDVAKIVSSVDPVTGATREKFSDFMSKYGSGRITPLTSQYDRVIAMHDMATPKRRISYTPENSPEPDVLAELGSYNASAGSVIHNEIVTNAKHITGNYNSSIRYGSLPSRSKDNSMYDINESGFQRSHYTQDAQVASRGTYSNTTDMVNSMKRTDSNNNVLHSSGFQSELTRGGARPGLNRSSTFSGMPSHVEGSTLGGRYAESRVGLDNLVGGAKRDLLRNPDSRYLSPGMKMSISGNTRIQDNSINTPAITSPRELLTQPGLRSQDTNIDTGLFENNGRESGRDYVGLRDSVREDASRSRDIDVRGSRGSMYWLYGTQGRPGLDNGSRMTGGSTKPVGQPWPGDYMMRLDSEYTPSKRYSASLPEEGSVPELGRTRHARDDNGIQYDAHLERSRYDSVRPSTPFAAAHGDDDTCLLGDTLEYNPSDLRSYEVISKPTIGQKSILRKSNGPAESGQVYGTRPYSDVPQYRGNSLGLQTTKQLPPLSSFIQNGTRRSSSGKKVTFNLAKNRFRAILD